MPHIHQQRAKKIVTAHPEVRDLIGKNPWTALITIGLVFVQIVLAFGAGNLDHKQLWLVLIGAFCVGAPINHSLYVVIHEATHNLIFAKTGLNKLTAIVADLPNVVPGAMGFRHYHLKHHSHLGLYDFDGDIPSRWEAKLVGNHWLTKAVWLFLFPLFQFGRLNRLRTSSFVDRWAIFGILCNFIFDVAIVVVCGWAGLLYLFLSFWFSTGLHPLGARWIQEHYCAEGSQPTTNYYGRFNICALNIGYHNEHHDFPSIPWNRLPRLTQLAPEYYRGLAHHMSWTVLLFAFIFDPRYSLFSRVER